jgi:Asp-tRNA(Asn)/Glu-tRNA(Gln) amidotransferase A subunit family amidase
MDIAFLTIAEIGRAYDTKELSPVEVTRALLDRIAAHDGKLNSFIRVTEDVALAEARTAERELMAGSRRGPMHGIPYGLKDIVETAGIPTTGHSKLRQDHVPGADAEIVRRLKNGGGVLLGKLATWEFASADRVSIAVAAGAQPVGPRPAAGRLVERARRGGRGGVHAGGDRHRHRRLDPRPSGVLRH